MSPTPFASAAPPPRVEIVSAGNEVLIGDVVDTNSNHLCHTVTGLGGEVTRTVMVRDDVQMIAAELRTSLTRRPDLVFTVGGLGPTSDDRTLEAERLVAEKYAEFHARGYVPFAHMTEARRKMAVLPRGATPLANPLGGAPAVLCEHDGTAIVSLPGVPGELRAIVEQSLGDLFQRVFGTACYEERALVAELQDESAIADELRRAEEEHPQVYVKSRAKVLGSTRVIRITLSARGRNAAAVSALLAPAADQLLRSVAAAGFAVRADGEPTGPGAATPHE